MLVKRCVRRATALLLRCVMGIWYGIPMMFVAIADAVGAKMRRAGAFLSNRLALAFANTFNKFSRYYCHIELLPKYAEDVVPCSLLTDTKEHEFAIVMQGPVLDGFTAETVRVYRKIFPKAAIIVSTWKNTDAKLAEELRSIADELILSEPPQTSGIGNINYQAKSSYAGIKRAHELGIPYAMKTRVDQRIYSPMLFEYMKSLLEAFPLDSRYSQWQKERIIVLPGGGIATPYYLADYFQFGTTQDLLNFFDFPPDPAVWNGKLWDKHVSAGKGWKWTDERGRERVQNATEIQLLKSYVMRMGPGDCKPTVENYFRDITARFLTVNKSELQLYWNKYYQTAANFWHTSEREYWESGASDEDRMLTAQLCLSLIQGHFLYDSKFEEYKSHMVEPFRNLGAFCAGSEHLDEVLCDVDSLMRAGK